MSNYYATEAPISGAEFNVEDINALRAHRHPESPPFLLVTTAVGKEHKISGDDVSGLVNPVQGCSKLGEIEGLKDEIKAAKLKQKVRSKNEKNLEARITANLQRSMKVTFAEKFQSVQSKMDELRLSVDRQDTQLDLLAACIASLESERYVLK